MWFKKFLVLNFLYYFIFNKIECQNQKPHIIIFIADDMGRNDLGICGSSQIPTPNIDALGCNGIIFNRHYTLHICTPSRTAILTGNFPIRAGMQGFPLLAGEPRALPINMPTLAEKLSELGYNTSAVGKWHLGHQNRSVTPNGRGFQTHFGYWSGFVGYSDYSIRDLLSEGFDLHLNYKPVFNHIGTYATDLFTTEAINIINNHNLSRPLFLMVNHLAAHTGKDGIALETPDPIRAQANYSYISDPMRRLYADIVNRLDTAIGKVVKNLQARGMLNNSILVFLSDNGAPTTGMFANWGSNWPLRGIKNTLWEGGVRNIGMMWSKMLKNKNNVENRVFHIADWFPTLYCAAGGDVSTLGKIDGVNHWPFLVNGTLPTTSRKDILVNIDEEEKYSAILSSDGHYKLTRGRYNYGTYDGYFGDSGRNNTPPYDVNAVLESDVCKAIQAADESWPPLTSEIILTIRNRLEIPTKEPRVVLPCARRNYCLFDLENDPTETTDISASNPTIVQSLLTSLRSYRKELVRQTNKMVDAAANPIFCSGSWFTWLDPVKKCDL